MLLPLFHLSEFISASTDNLITRMNWIPFQTIPMQFEQNWELETFPTDTALWVIQTTMWFSGHGGQNFCVESWVFWGRVLHEKRKDGDGAGMVEGGGERRCRVRMEPAAGRKPRVKRRSNISAEQMGDGVREWWTKVLQYIKREGAKGRAVKWSGEVQACKVVAPRRYHANAQPIWGPLKIVPTFWKYKTG